MKANFSINDIIHIRGGFSILIFSSMSSRKSMYKVHPSGSAHPP